MYCRGTCRSAGNNVSDSRPNHVQVCIISILPLPYGSTFVSLASQCLGLAASTILTLLQGLEMARRVSSLYLLPILTSPTIGSHGQPAFFSPFEQPCYSCIEIPLEFIHEKIFCRWNHAKERKKKKNAQDSHDDTDRKMLSDHPVGNTIHPKRYKTDVTALHFCSVNSLSSFLTLIPPETQPHHKVIPHPNPPSPHSLIPFVLSDIN